jgi:hypothetical protein
MDEMQESRRLVRRGGPRLDPERVRALESLRLAKADIQRQLTVSVHVARRQQLVNALAEINGRISALKQTA